MQANDFYYYGAAFVSLLLVILSLVFAIYAPLMFGGMLFEKMKGE